VNPAEDYPPTPEGSFYDCWGTVGILTDNCPPAGKLWAILPVLIERWRSNNCNRYRRLADASTFGRVETKPHTRGQIQSVIGGIIFPRKETTTTDSQVIQAVLHRFVYVRGCAR